MLGGGVGTPLLSGVRRALRRVVRLMVRHWHAKQGCFGHRRGESQPDANDQEFLNQWCAFSQQATVRQRTTRSLVLSRPFWVLEILPIDH
jgi:hypothetical protein